ncbi:AcrR family transcriptional regulator [Microbacterium trichothecenolyticum]|uniref:TetR/AcrR family transcriptional regulator n=1 Tax=Microbacterium trichothecenolyticum TaxID=69370 RepID=UPI0028625087|nr:TetR/AcrR family transcriptional regulator [Microbacterium trichothecenolyticum]MDR7112262.1 AcrR family transcriptional regulator [Microbacterium trichothecenolyticum]
MTRPPRDRATGSKQVQRRDALLERLVDVILREGFADASVEDLARGVQCSKTTLYAIAPSKEQIVVAGVRHFFRRAADRVEIRLLRTSEDPLEQIRGYLVAISEQLAPASAAFFADLDAWPATREIYRTNTRAAADKVQSLVHEAAPGDQNAAFVGAVAAQVMEAIHRGEIETTAGLDDSAAYRALAELIVRSLQPSDEAGEA